MFTGTIADAKKSFYFIQVDGSKEYDGELFCHYSEIKDQDGYKDLSIGDRVVFDIGENHLGLCAIDVKTTEGSQG